MKSRHRRNQWSTILFKFMEFPDFMQWKNTKFRTKLQQFWTTLLNSMLGKLILYKVQGHVIYRHTAYLAPTALQYCTQPTQFVSQTQLPRNYEYSSHAI